MQRVTTLDTEKRDHSFLEFNIVLSSTVAVSLVFLFVSALFVDAVVDLVDDEDASNNIRAPVSERNTLPYETNGEFGVALEVGEYELLATENEWSSTHSFVEYSLPIDEGGAAPDDAVISLAVWRRMFHQASKSRLSQSLVLISKRHR